MQRSGRRRSTRSGQIMVLFALGLPVLAGFLALSVAASLSLNTKSHLDGATLAAGIAAAGDACMSSPYGYDLYECQAGGVQPGYLTAGLATAGSAALPGPPYTAGNLPPLDAHQDVSNPDGVFCPGALGSGLNCVTAEQQLAQVSAESAVRAILQADYSQGYDPPATCPATDTPAVCLGMVNLTTVVFQVNVSYWYYLDTDDLPSGCAPGATCPATLGNDRPSPDAVQMGSYPIIPPVAPDCTLAPPPVLCNAGQADPLRPTTDHDNTFPGPGAAAPANSTLLCPAATRAEFSRQIVVTTWIQLHFPLAALVGGGSSTFSSTSRTFGCAG